MSSPRATTRSTSATGPRIGINVPNYGASSGADALWTWFARAEDAGYDIAMVSDHVAITPDVRARYPAPFADPFATLAWAAARTTRMLLGTTVVILPYRHPLITAALAGTVHRLSGGRFVLGVGAGWAAQEFAALGQDVAQAAAVSDEQLRALTTLLRDEVATYHGGRYSFDEVRTGIDPDDPVAVWVGGNSPAALRRTARYGDAWHPLGASIATLERGRQRLADEAARADRTTPAGRVTRTTPALAPRVVIRPTAQDVAGSHRAAGHGTWTRSRVTWSGWSSSAPTRSWSTRRDRPTNPAARGS